MKGYYTIKLGENILKKENLITLFGDSFFLNRAINNEFKPIEYIVFGNSNVRPSKNDLTLGNETLRKQCFKKIDLENNRILLICNVEVNEIEDTCEIGVSNGDILISHDIYELDDNFIDETVDTVEIKYTFDLR